MPRLLQIAILTVMAFFGVALIFAGVHFWMAAPHMTGPTLFDTVRASANSDGLFCGTPDPLFDKQLVLHRVAAAATSVFGISAFCWAVILMREASKVRRQLANPNR